MRDYGIHHSPFHSFLWQNSFLSAKRNISRALFCPTFCQISRTISLRSKTGHIGICPVLKKSHAPFRLRVSSHSTTMKDCALLLISAQTWNYSITTFCMNRMRRLNFQNIQSNDSHLSHVALINLEPFGRHLKQNAHPPSFFGKVFLLWVKSPPIEWASLRIIEMQSIEFLKVVFLERKSISDSGRLKAIRATPFIFYSVISSYSLAVYPVQYSWDLRTNLVIFWQDKQPCLKFVDSTSIWKGFRL